MASTIFGVSYDSIVNVLMSDNPMGYVPVDEGSFVDSGETPTPLNFSFTMNGGAQVVSGPYDSIVGIISSPSS